MAARSKNEAPDILLQPKNEAPDILLQTKNEAPDILLQPKNEGVNEAPYICLNKTELNGTEPNGTELNQTKLNGTERKETEGNSPPALAEGSQMLDDLTRYQQLINLLRPSWSKIPTWGSEDNHALSENLENLCQLQLQDWQKLAYFILWANSADNIRSRDPEQLTSKRSGFLQNLSSYLDRTQRIWKFNGSPALEKAVTAFANPSTKPATAAPSEFESPQARAIFFRSLLPDKKLIS